MDVPVGYSNDQHIRGNLKEVGDLAVWSVSSAKPGNGVELLRDGSTDTYWQ
jgi:anaphase-promoting complex subunit 10